MTVEQVRYFMEVAYCRNFSQAARNLYVSQPSLTKHIAALESELGVRLFDRTTRRVELTEVGYELMAKSHSILMPLIRSLDDVRMELANKRPTVYIGIIHDELLPEYIQDILRQLNLTNKNNSLYMVSQDTHVHLNESLGSQYQMIVSSDHHLTSFPGRCYLNLKSFRMVFVVSKNHPMADKPNPSPEDFQSEPMFFSIPNESRSTSEVANMLSKNVGVPLNVKLMSTPSDVLRNVQLCAGAAIVPDLYDRNAYPDLLFLDFHDYKDDHVPTQRLFWLENEKNPGVKKLVRELAEHFGPVYISGEDPNKSISSE